MPIQSAQIKTGATGLTVVGGTDMSFSPDGVSIPSGVHVSVATDADYRIRRNMTLKNKPPTLSNGVYSKDKKALTFVAPKILASGATVFNLIRIEREVHPETSAAEALELNMVGGQGLSDADFASFWSAGNLS